MNWPNTSRRVLQDIFNTIEAGEDVIVTVREILSWFHSKRRGVYVTNEIRVALEEANLTTHPNFEYVYIDSPVQFFTVKQAVSTDDNETLHFIEGYSQTGENSEIVVEQETLTFVSGAVNDPTFRIGQLKASNTTLISVNPNSTLTEATTLMMLNDFSQLPVMQNDRLVKGVISWESIGKQVALNRSGTTVRDYMETSFPEVNQNTSLLSSIDLIVRYGYVLVRQNDNKYTGVVTTSDLSLQFRQLAEPFLLIGEIENYVRRLIDGKFTTEQLSTVKEPNDIREINKVSDLTFGQYVRLLENPTLWASLNKPSIDRNTFIKYLDKVRELRNDIMHFDPDPFEEDDIQILRSFVNFMRNLNNL